MIVTTAKDGCLVDVEAGVASDGAFVPFKIVEKPAAKANPVLSNIVPSWSSVDEFLVHDEDAKGIQLSLVISNPSVPWKIVRIVDSRLGYAPCTHTLHTHLGYACHMHLGYF